MAISYPVNTPTNIGIANITLMAESAVSISSSPFTFQQQVVAHPGQRWAASISLPPMKRQDAENWIAFLLSLKGQVGTFLLGDPNCAVAQGVAEKNLLIYTEQFDNTAWTNFGTATTVTPNTTLAPDSTLTADTFVVAGANGGRGQTVNVVAGQTYTFSCWLQGTAGQTLFFGIAGSESLITLTTSWVRYSRTITASTSGLVTFFPASTYGAATARTFYVWGAQLELGSVATTYQPIVAGTELVNGAGQIGGTLNIDGCSPSVTGYLMPGDYIQLGSGVTTRLHKVLTQVNTDASGQATLDIWPDLRGSPADNSAVTLRNARGRFRLKENITQWNINEMSTYGITFDCVEAL